MKLNGALKPPKGASVQGSSPGVVPRKYRDKRYYKVNEDVINRLTLNECGANKNNYNKNICINNQQPAAPDTHRLQQQQQQQDKECDENFVYSNNKISSSSNLSNCNIYTFTKTYKKTEIKLASSNTIQIRDSTIVKEKPNKAKIEIYLKRGITTRQTKNTNKIRNNKNNNKRENNKEKLKVFKSTLKDTRSNSAADDDQGVGIISCNEVNKFLSLSPKIYENLNLPAIISRLFIQFKLLLFIFSHAIKHFTENSFVRCVCDRGRGIGGGGTAIGCHSFGLTNYYLVKTMRASQSLEGSLELISFKNVHKSRLPPTIALYLMVCAAAVILLPQPVVGDDGDTFFPANGLETTTPEFDYASRGQKKFGDKCDNTLECGFPGSICDPKKKSCQCTEDLPVTNHIDKCGKEAAVNESCFFNEQCEVKYFQTECRDQRCVCRFDMTPVWLKDGSVECKGRGDKKGPETYIDPAMIGVLIGMALMFIIICVVLRLFSQARWRENRTIFNTPNPRLMNVSLLRESKLLHGQERRGSRMSVRAPSRQPSMASLRPHSPNPSLGKTGSRSNSHGSNASGTSIRSTRSNSVSPAGIVVNNSHNERKSSTYQPQQHQHPTHQKLQQQQQQEQQPLTQTNIISNPVAETVTVEIIEPGK